MEVMGDSEDMLGAHRGTLSHLSTVVQRSVHDVITRWAIKSDGCLCAAGWASSSGNIVSNDRDKLRLLPEMERVLWKELQWINQREPDMQHMAQQAGIGGAPRCHSRRDNVLLL